VSDLGALSIGFVLGLAIVGAVLLRNEEEVRMAWRRRRGIVEPDEPVTEVQPKAPQDSPWFVALHGLLVIMLVHFAVSEHNAFSIAVAVLTIAAFGVILFRYRRSRSPTCPRHTSLAVSAPCAHLVVLPSPDAVAAKSWGASTKGNGRHWHTQEADGLLVESDP
jgi:hypothetical protein